jgi:hypothetical protein
VPFENRVRRDDRRDYCSEPQDAAAARSPWQIEGVIDPAKANEKPIAGQGHLHYQLDNGPVIATPTPKLSFHRLTPDVHTIVVTLAGNDHKPLGPQQKVMVTVPRRRSRAKP